ncbi:MAG TPA: DNA polymerase III subunit gamma/tau [Candidatus Limnocylindria bacterium]|nr:DNA polymerase III subunit gamma/tau [Candidatus Limnocylindria bacterium]
MPTEPPAEPALSDPSRPSTDQHRALYRRWRAQRFRELIGQDPIVATLQRAVAADRTAHAYLFVGPRGTGKTSTARILAKAINCTDRGEDGEPCDTCPACVAIRDGRAMDVIEIDAASHGLVEDARDLVMRALTSPAELRRRVYIIDEVHMLSAHAFNALLKMVEEPPDHVVFILATTDTHKVPATIISRTQRFDFRRLPADAIVGKLTRITSAEGAEAEPEALALIARLADGGMRDAESLLDQVLAYAGDRVTAAAVREAVGLADDDAIAALLDAYVASDTPAALDRIEALADGGRDMAQVAAQAEVEARQRLLASAADPPTARRLAVVLRTLAEAAAAGAREGRSRLAMELLAVDPGGPPVHPAAPSVSVPITPSPAPAKTPTAPAPERKAEPKPVPLAATPEESAQPVADGDVSGVRTRWADVVERASPAIKPLLRECRPIALDGARLTLAFPEERGFMREKARTRAASIEQLLGTVLGGSWAVDCVASNVELEPLTIQQAVAPDPGDADGQALLEGVLRITGGELVDAPEVR